MAERLTPAHAMRPKRPRGRPRKDGKPPRQRANATEATRLELLERGRLAFIEAERRKQEYRSAYRIYAQVVKDARRAGATEIAWTLEALRRDPLEVEREISERIRMARLTKIIETKEEATARERELERRGHCIDCGVNTYAIGHYYMVSDDLWASAGMEPDGGMLCLDCLEKRIGRRLTYDDFTAIVPDAWGANRVGI
jgi:hypothetical protein